MDIFKLILLAFFAYVFFDLFVGGGSLHLRLGRKEKPILKLKIGDVENQDTEKEEGPF